MIKSTSGTSQVNPLLVARLTPPPVQLDATQPGEGGGDEVSLGGAITTSTRHLAAESLTAAVDQVDGIPKTEIGQPSRQAVPLVLSSVADTPGASPAVAAQPLEKVLGRIAWVNQAATFHRQQAYQVMDRMLAAKDPVTGLLPLHVRTEGSNLVPTDHIAAGLDVGRQTAGLVLAAQLARSQADPERAQRYLLAAETNYLQGKKLLAGDGDFFVQRRDFNADGSVKSTEIGEPGKSSPGADDMSRVNPRGYAFRGAGELYLATGKPAYKEDFNRYFQAWVRDFHDDAKGGFFVHGGVGGNHDHTERSAFKSPGGLDAAYDGTQGAKGNDATIYALSGVLLTANEVLATPQTQSLVKEQMDLIVDKFHRQNGMLWENYTTDFEPISQDWQNQPLPVPEGQPSVTSHVAIGGHTAMAGQQVIEGARQLLKQGVISSSQYQTYLDKAVNLFQDFASISGAVDWETGAVHNAILVEEPKAEARWLKGWGDASWQQAELLQTLLRLEEENRLQDIQGPGGKTGGDLLAAAENFYQKNYAVKSDYAFSDYFGNPDVYHVPQVAQYFQQAAASQG